MNLQILENKKELGRVSGKIAGNIIREILTEKGYANIILATGTSQFETLQQLVSESGIDWSKVTLFHLDEYLGLPITHQASFRKYLIERFTNLVKPELKAINLIDGEADAVQECKRLGDLIKNHPIDLAFVGFGENGHLAFNDPPADFETEEPYLVVELDEACRNQQFSEGWFETLEAVPKQAISMSIRQIMKSAKIICTVPEVRKAMAVKNCLTEAISPQYPASILRQHAHCAFFLDKEAASLLPESFIAQFSLK